MDMPAAFARLSVRDSDWQSLPQHLLSDIACRCAGSPPDFRLQMQPPTFYTELEYRKPQAGQPASEPFDQSALAAMRLVCTAWQRAAESSVAVLLPRQYSNAELAWLLLRLPALQALYLHPRAPCHPGLQAALQPLAKLRNLSLQGRPSGLRSWPRADLPQLVNLSLFRCKAMDSLAPLAGLTGLQGLCLADCAQLPDTALEGLSALTGLQNLDLRGVDQLAQLGCAALARLTQLTRLALGQVLPDADQVLAASLSRLTSLRDLQVGAQRGRAETVALLLPQLTSLVLHSANSALPQRLASASSLQHLELAYDWSWEMPPACVASVAAFGPLPALRTLRVSGAGVTPGFLQWLRHSTALEELRLPVPLTGADLAPLRALTQLRRLALLRAGGMDADSVEHIMALPQLEELYIPGTYNFLAAAAADRLPHVHVITGMPCSE